MRLIIPGIWILLLSSVSYADNYMRQPEIDVLHYDISLELKDASDTVAGITRIRVRMRGERVSGMKLDFAGMQIDDLQVGGTRRSYRYGDNGLYFSFDRKYSRNEIATVEVRYHGKPARGLLIGKNNYGRRVFFTENWPANAHYWFPSIDHPCDKATVKVTVTAPSKYEVISNGLLVRAKSLKDGRKLTQWNESRAIPTYCVAIGAAEFSIARQKDIDHTQIYWYFFPQDAEAAFDKFRRTAPALRFFSSLIARYPYEKLAQVQATVTIGGMENASAIFYIEPSFQDALSSDNPVPHEIAHQWFGDSVTPADWDDLWLSEGFATYFEALFNQSEDGPESLKKTMAEYAQRIRNYGSARLLPLIDPGQNDPVKKLNALTYEKGAWVLHMLRGVLGDTRFFQGIRRYYSQYKGKNATSEDFQKVMESMSGISLGGFFKQWLHQPGWPEYSIAWHWHEASSEAEIVVRQTQTTGVFDMPLDIIFLEGAGKESRRLRICNEEHSFRIPLRSRPLSIEIDPDVWVLKSVSTVQF